MTLMLSFFFFNDTATPEIYTLSLHDALPIWRNSRRVLLLIAASSRASRALGRLTRHPLRHSRGNKKAHSGSHHRDAEGIAAGVGLFAGRSAGGSPIGRRSDRPCAGGPPARRPAFRSALAPPGARIRARPAGALLRRPPPRPVAHPHASGRRGRAAGRRAAGLPSVRQAPPDQPARVAPADRAQLLP